MIVAVASDKGSPGASTLSLLMGACWPGDRVVVLTETGGYAEYVFVRRHPMMRIPPAWMRVRR